MLKKARERRGGARFARLNITIPQTIKERMEAVDDVNWSAVARKAFEEVLKRKGK